MLYMFCHMWQFIHTQIQNMEVLKAQTILQPLVVVSNVMYQWVQLCSSNLVAYIIIQASWMNASMMNACRIEKRKEARNKRMEWEGYRWWMSWWKDKFMLLQNKEESEQVMDGCYFHFYHIHSQHSNSCTLHWPNANVSIAMVCVYQAGDFPMHL